MKTIHLRKLTAIMEVKGRTLFSKNLIIMPAFSLAFTYPDQNDIRKYGHRRGHKRLCTVHGVY